jgi:tetratricopeptide (TPR) repeat protein
LNPYDPTIVEGAVRNYMEQREYTSAIAHLLRALGGNHPQPAQLLALLALCLLQSGTSNIKNLVDLCLMLVERSLALHPTEEGYLVKATILVQKEQFSEALKSYDNILSFNPHSSFALVGKARIHNMNAQHEEALKYAQMAIPFSEGETKQQALFLKMMSLRELQRFEEAFQAAKELLTLNPDDIAALTIMTSYFVSKGDYESALKPLNKIKNPSISILELKLGVYIAMRDSNQILLCSNEILQKDSKHKRALAMKKMALIELSTF